MRAFGVVTILFATVAFALPLGDLSHRQLFEDFKLEFGRKYKSAEEETVRFRYFDANMKLAADAQRRNPYAVFGPTDLSDLSPAEFKLRHNSRPHFKRWAAEIESTVPSVPLRTPAEVASRPSSINWVDKGAVTYVKNQANCGSCWSFSTTGNIEGQWFLAGHKLVALSEQELVSCDTNDIGCNGGLPSMAMDWLVKKRNGWITAEADYPYKSGSDNENHQCHLPKPNVAQIAGHRKIPKHEGQMATYLAAHGPVSIGVDAGNDWANYKSGVMTDCTAGTPDHAVLLVGYDTSASPPYWIIKNSWGPKWGDKGYLKVEYGTNQCDLTYAPVSSIVNSSGPTPPPPPPPGPTPPTPPPPETTAAPLVPPPPPPPTPASGNYSEWKCGSSATCDRVSCRASSHFLNTCVVNPSGVGSSKAKCEPPLLKIYKWNTRTDCGNIEDDEDEWPLNMCFMDLAGSYRKFDCNYCSRTPF